MKLRWHRKFGLVPRIALVILLTMLATAMLQRLLQRVVPPPSIIMLDQHWLSERAAEAAQLALRTPATMQQKALASLESSAWLDFNIESAAAPATIGSAAEPAAGPTRPTNSSTQPVPHPVSLPALSGKPTRLLTSVAQETADRLGIAPARVRATAEVSSHDIDRELDTLVVLVSRLPVRFIDVTRSRMQPDILILRNFHIAIRLTPSRWLVVSQNKGQLGTVRRFRNITMMLVALLLIGSMSLWVARGLIRPLTRLAAAAERLGREREPTLIAEMPIPEYASIARTFNEMQLRLKQFVDERTHMLAAIAHDLRTPLTRLRLFAEYVHDKVQQRQLLSDIAEMDAMISSTLAFASDEAKSEKHIPVDVAALLISLCDNACDAGGHAVYHGPDHAQLPCQPMAMRRAFANLVDNGCKYAEHVAIELHDEADALVITIGDDGPGIPPAQIEQAFAPFQRLEASRNRDTGGTGLGLSIARDVVNGHGGSIHLMEARPHGLLVRICLPKPGAAATWGRL